MTTWRELENILIDYFCHDAREDNGNWVAVVEVDVEFDVDEQPTETGYVNLTDLARFICGAHLKEGGQHGR